VTTFDRYLRYAELVDELRVLADRHPDLLALESIGRSHEGRDIWLATITASATGPHDAKPAHWVDANIHAGELTGSVAALFLIDHLLTAGPHDDLIRRAVETRTFYVVPRVNPDGAELALADHPRYLRSSVRPWPWRDATARPGLREEDVDGDGRLLLMRRPDPNGAWAPHPDEPRLLVRRPPDGGPRQTTYRLLVEGSVVDHDGFTIPTPPAPEGLDLNRNFPAGWATSVTGSGDFPGSEPEIRHLVQAIVDRPNICGYNAFHTSGGVLLRPSSMRSDRDLPPVDVWTWRRLGERATALTGYPVHSVYEDFTWDKSRPMSGAADDWAYEHLGVYSWTTEFWDVIRAATGVGAPTDIWTTGPTAEQELAVLRWCDEHHPGELYVDWYPFEHPQLGPVELGGWDFLRSWDNPPPSRLADEVAAHAGFAVHQALAAPRLELLLADATPEGDGLWRIRAGIANTGWLPTTVTRRAADENLVLPIVAELELPSGAEVVDGTARREVGQLAGRSGFDLAGGSHNDGTPDRVLVTWLVRVPRQEPEARPTVRIDARHPRAGAASTTLELGSARP
jgi:hypothetical protein